MGSYESLSAAIKAGAGSVYFGVGAMNMRSRSAANFSLEDLANIVSICKEHHVNSYLTVNTIIYNDELPQMHELLDAAKSCGVTAIIASDMAVIQYAREIGIEIHLSTQCNVTNVEAVRYYAQFADVVVLGRECTLQQIADICKEIGAQQITGPRGELVKIEVFIHGALCVSYSGQCLTSENFGGRSANRGQCAQSCRLPYRIFVDGKEWKDPKARYLFSTRDLCALPKLEELREIGVESLKVEGRLKSPEYVAAVSHAYRKALEILSEKGYKENAECANGKAAELTAQDLEPLEVLFSRGLNTGWLDGVNHQELVDGSFSNHHGEFIGTVVQVDRNGVIVELEDKPVPCTLLPGDGILFEEYRAEPEPRQTGSRLYKATWSASAHDTRSAKNARENARGSAGKSQVLLEFGREFNLRKVTYGMKAYRNDSPALVSADVGIAISNGAAIAREIADITIAEDDLKSIVTLRKLSIAMMKRIGRNYRSILSVNGGLIALGVSGLAQPTTTAMIHNGSTLGIGLLSTKKLI